MSEHPTTHSTFTIERSYAAAPQRVFAAWSEPEAKARWFSGPDSEHRLDFRPGGEEWNSGRNDKGEPLSFESQYRDIVAGERIVYTSTLAVAERPVTVSITTVELAAEGSGTALTLTQQATFLDGFEQPEWREKGTGDQLDGLAAELGEGSE